MRAWYRTLLVVVSTALTLLLVEGTCRLYLQLVEPTAWWRGRLPQYQNAPYYSREFLAEQSNAFDILVPPSRKYLLFKDVSGRHFNITNGIRLTTDRPAAAKRRVLVFGGSTIQSGEVPDAYTIPSFLQRAINARCRTPAAVVNYGVEGVNIGEQLARLEDVAVTADDVVVFYDGVNEIFSMVYRGERSLTFNLLPLGETAGPAEPLSLGERIVAKIRRTGDAIATVRVLTRRHTNVVPTAMTDAAILQRNLDLVERNYAGMLVAAHERVTSAGGRFIHVLQPHLYATPATTPDRRVLQENERQPGVEEAFRLGYPRLRAAIATARRQGVFTIDLSGILAAERVPPHVFFDSCHVNEVGNEAVARAIFAMAGDQFGGCDDHGQ
jgi:hypothetical protein